MGHSRSYFAVMTSWTTFVARAKERRMTATRAVGLVVEAAVGRS
jgi:hypothetical protein